jgi:VanZ family protein
MSARGQAPPVAVKAGGHARLSSALFALYVIAVFVGGCVRLPSGSGGNNTDKFQHAAAFGLMAVLAMQMRRAQRPETALSRLGLEGWMLSATFGAILEFVQAFIPYRGCELLDWVADGLGAALGVALMSLLLRRRAR